MEPFGSDVKATAKYMSCRLAFVRSLRHGRVSHRVRAGSTYHILWTWYDA